MGVLETIIIWSNGLRGRISRRRFPAKAILLLMPHCLQKQECPEPVKEDIRRCKGCGRCKIKDLRAMAERLGAQVHVASGGREALARAQAQDVQVVLAVACSKELAEGIRGAFPKRVVGVLNSWPHGACKDTDVDVAAVEAALKNLVDARAGEGTPKP